MIRYVLMFLCCGVLYNPVSGAEAAAADKDEEDAINKKELAVLGSDFSDNGIDTVTEDLYGLIAKSNGRVWSDYLADLMFIKTNPDCPKQLLINYAFSGAGTGWGNERFSSWSGLLWQVEQFLCQCRKKEAIAKATIIVQMTGMHLFVQRDPSAEKIILEDMKSVVSNLLHRGAKKIVILALMDPDKVPQYKQERLAQKVSSVNKAVYEFLLNKKCKKGETLEKDACYMGVKYAEGYLEAVEKEFDIVNTTLLSQITDGNSLLIKRGRYNDFRKYMWYDQAHFTTAAHEKLAALLHKELSKMKWGVAAADGDEAKKDEDGDEDKANALRILRL